MPPKPKPFTFSKSHSNPKSRNNNVPCIVQSFFELAARGPLSEAISSLGLLSRKGIRLPSKSLAFLLQRCGDARSLKFGKWVHLHLKLTGLKKPDTYLANNLIGMYLKCGDNISAYKVFDKMSERNLYSWNNMLSGYAKLGMVKPARKLFDTMPERDVVSWNLMVNAYANGGFHGKALRFYKEFRRLGMGYNEYNFTGFLTVCVKFKELNLTRQAHGQVIRSGFLLNVVILSSIVDAYVKCQDMGDARKLFDEINVRDVLSWTTMLSGYAQMGNIEAAVELFDLMPKRSPVSWNAMIAGYARHGSGDKALELFKRMILSGFRPDQFTFSSCLCACASIASLRLGKQVHGYLTRMNFRPNTIVVSALIDMYSKCGSLEAGRTVFGLMGNKQDVVLWNTMISSLAQHGYGKEAVQMFDQMVRSGAKPNKITFVVILSACSHSGLLMEGVRLFESMTSDHDLIPEQEHCTCLIDLLGQAGHFDTLMKQLEKMLYHSNDQIWNVLVGVHKSHGNIELGKEAAEQLLEFEPQSLATYLLSIYGAQRRWEMEAKTRQRIENRSERKECIVSWIEIENKVHSFSVSDRSHPSKDVIYSVLEQLSGHMEEVHYLIPKGRSFSSLLLAGSNERYLAEL